MADEQQECPKCLQHVPLWMVTFADMSSLLMAFFVLLTMLTPKGISDEEIQILIQSFREGYSGIFDGGGKSLSKGKLPEMGMTVESLPSSSRGKKDNSALSKAKAFLKDEISRHRVEVIPTKNGFAIELLGSLYFKPGSSNLRTEAKEVLDKVSYLIIDLEKESVDNAIKVKGYSDGSVFASHPSLKYTNNLELSSQRANSVIGYFWDVGVNPTRQYKGKTYAKFHSVSYGEFQPLEDNISPEQRAYNRRVEIEFYQDPDAT